MITDKQVETSETDAAKCLACGQKMLPTDIWERRLQAANERIKELEKYAGRYLYLRDRTCGDRYPSGVARFRLPDIKAHEGIFRGSVAQHLDAAIDAEIDK